MFRSLHNIAARHRRWLLPIPALAGIAVAALVGVALARTFTLAVARDAKLVNQSGTTVHANLVINGRQRVVYYLTGDGPHRAKCTKANSCLTVWPPVTVGAGKSASKAPGISGKLAIWKHGGLRQVTLGGHPLYTYAGDTQRRVGTGEGIQSFGGVWHGVRATAGSGAAPAGATSTSTSTSSTATTTSTSSYCLYPPCP